MSEWRQRRLTEIAHTFAGGTPDRSRAEFFGGEIPWIKSTELNAATVRSTEEKITELGFRMSAAKWTPPGSTVVAMYGATAGQVAFLGIPATANQAVLSVVPHEGVSPRFLYYALAHSKSRLVFLAQGSGQPNLSKQIVDRLELSVPGLQQQRRIAEILSTVDDAIEQTERLIAKTQNLKAGLMHDLFTRGVLPDGRLRPPRQEAPELYQESVLGWIPVGWGVKPIGQVFDVQLGKMLSKKSKTGKMSAPYVGNRAVQWDRVDVAALEEMDFSDSERKKYLLAPKDLLVCEGGEVGRTAMWRGEMEECYFQKAIHRLRPKDARVIPEYMLRFMRFGDTAGIFRMFTSQSSIAHLTREKLCAVQMPLPSEPEQRQIAGIFDAVDEDLFGQGATRNFLGGVKRGLMHDLLTGRCLGRKRDVYL